MAAALPLLPRPLLLLLLLCCFVDVAPTHERAALRVAARAFLRSVEAGDSQRATRFLRSATLDARDLIRASTSSDGVSALHLASYNGDIRTLDALLAILPSAARWCVCALRTAILPRTHARKKS